MPEHERNFLIALLRPIAEKVFYHMRKIAPVACGMLESHVDSQCRLFPPLPFASVSLVGDVTSHYHKDPQNLGDGATAIVTLINPKYRTTQTAPQMHVLPLNSCAFNLGHGDILIESAIHELHGTTPPPIAPDDEYSRVAIVLYSHDNLGNIDHGKFLNPNYTDKSVFTRQKNKIASKQKPCPKSKKSSNS